MEADTDPAMAAVRERFEKSQLSLDELGLKMGYPAASARKSAWQFIHRTNDPRLSMLRKFAAALGVKVSSLVKD
jgi:transcriptional regulator with XRE-family HTH domain